MASKDKKQTNGSTETQKPASQTETRRIKHPVVWMLSILLLGLIIISFIGAPIIGRIAAPSGKMIFGKYKGEEIEYRPGNYFSYQRDNLADAYGANFQDENIEWQAYQVWRGAFDRTVLHTHILLEAEKSGLTVTEKLIDRSLLNYPAYTENGEFSEDKYNAVSSQEQLAIRNRVKEELIHNQYVEDLVSGGITGVKHSTAEVEFIKEMASEERNFSYAYFGYNDYPESEVISYGSNNSNLFREVHLAKITVSSQEQALELITVLEENPDEFSVLAQEESTDVFAAEGGDMGIVRYHELLPVFENEADVETIFTLGAGEISPALESRGVYAIYKSIEPPAPADFSTEEDITAVRRYMERYERGIIEDYLQVLAADFSESALSQGFDSAALQMDVSTGLTDFFPLNYGNLTLQSSYGNIPFFKPIQSVDQTGVINPAATRESVLTSLFSLEEDGFSEPFVLDDKVVVFKLNALREAADSTLQSFESYYPYAVQQWREQELVNSVLNSDALVDNFNQKFQQLFLSSN